MNEMTTTNHWNDRYYESTNCPLCGEFEMAKTIDELQVAIDNHKCPVYKGYCPECEHYVCHCEEYNLA